MLTTALGLLNAKSNFTTCFLLSRFAGVIPDYCWCIVIVHYRSYSTLLIVAGDLSHLLRQ
jgi:hypothetical protein